MGDLEKEKIFVFAANSLPVSELSSILKPLKGHTGISRLWTGELDAGLWRLDSGGWTLDTRLCTLDARLWKLSSGR